MSETGEREGERFHTLPGQRERIEAACARDGLELLAVYEERDVSGGAPLARRPGLLRAVEAIEAGEAEAVVVAFFERLFRSLAVQAEVVQRVEEAGGAILAVDVGPVTNGSAGQWLSGTMLGAVSEYQRRTTAERTQDAKRRAIARGVPTFANIPLGYRRDRDERGKLTGPLVPDPVTAPIVAEAFMMRAAGATIMDVRAFLAEHGIGRAFHGVQAMLRNRIYLGELRFGDLLNETAHPAIVDADTFNRVQRLSIPRGRRASSDRLLARLGVLRCGTCGSRMVVGTSKPGGKLHSFYRCPPVGDCPQRVTISAEKAEAAVIEAVQAALEGVEGSATVGEGVEHAENGLERAQGALDAAIRAFNGLTDEPAARDRLAELRASRDVAREHLDRLASAHGPAVTVSAGDWDLLTMEERRALIAAVVERATVAPGRGPDKITVQVRGE